MSDTQKLNQDETPGVTSNESEKQKRKMRSPQDVKDSDNNTPAFEDLFSKLFSSVLNNGNLKNNSNEECCPKNLNSSDSDKDSESDSESDSQECKDSDKFSKWDSLNKLLESHLNLTRCLRDLIKSRNE
jgi:hypothetical protein